MQRFAFDLRSLRQQGGRLSYKELAKRAHYAPTTLSEAAKGEKLPTLEVVRAFVTACGGDQDAWEQRWWEVHHQLGRQESNGGPSPAAVTSQTTHSDPQPVAPLREPDVVIRRPRRPWLAAAGVAVVVALASGGALWASDGFFPATSRPPRLLPLRLFRALGPDGSYVRIWAMTTDTAQAARLTSSARYGKSGVVGDCYTRQEPGTVPVWHHTYTFKDDRYQQHLYTIETDRVRDDALNWGWTERDPRPVCYVYSTPVPGTKPLYRMREDPLDQTNALRDGHGHVHTADQTSYRGFGFVVDQTWYLPTEQVRDPPVRSLNSQGSGRRQLFGLSKCCS